MNMVNIIRGGLQQQVSQETFESIYKPHGWEIDDAGLPPADDELQKTIKSFGTDQSAIKNFVKMARSESRYFDDKLFKSEEA